MIAKYSCQCLDAEAEVEVPERAEHTNVVFYIEMIVMNKIGADHCKRSPNCKATHVKHIKVPVTDRGVGRP